jgi:hypothetical protein
VKQYIIASAATIGTLALAMIPAQADIQYTQETRMPERPGDKPFSTTVTYKRPGAERTETTYQFGQTEQKSVSLTVCAKKERYTLEPALKMYYATPLVSSSAASKPPAVKAAAGQKTGTMTMTLVSIKDLGAQKVGQFNSRGYEIVTRMQTSGCMGNSDIRSKQQIFVAPQATLAGGGDGCNDMTSTSADASSSCKTAMIQKGDWARYQRLTRAFRCARASSKTRATPCKWKRKPQKFRAPSCRDHSSPFPPGSSACRCKSSRPAQSKAMMDKITLQQSSRTRRRVTPIAERAKERDISMSRSFRVCGRDYS